uniref:Secreted protein n=1 Tax=Daphnia galeata TaxID=27404 RepID=A0A8J2W2X6_9CRUS|nr:unnamed protein product [Daphnia galeata]
MVFKLNSHQWRLFVLLLAFQALAIIESKRASVANAAPFPGSGNAYVPFVDIGRTYGYRGRPTAIRRPYVRPSGTKRPLGPDEEYQYRPDDISYIFYS